MYAKVLLCLALPAGWVEHPTAGTTARVRKRRKEEIAQMQQMARGDEPLSLPPTFYQHSLLGFSAVQWEAPQLSHCRGVLHALRRHGTDELRAQFLRIARRRLELARLFRQPLDLCVREIWKMACFTYFPKCGRGNQKTKYLRWDG